MWDCLAAFNDIGIIVHLAVVVNFLIAYFVALWRTFLSVEAHGARAALLGEILQSLEQRER